MTGEVKRCRPFSDRSRVWRLCGGNTCCPVRKKVVLVDKAELGGVCLNRGCIPSKALISASERVKHIKHANTMGLKVSSEVQADMPEVVKWKDGIVNKLTDGIRTLLKGNGVEVISGEAYLTEAHIAK